MITLAAHAPDALPATAHDAALDAGWADVAQSLPTVFGQAVDEAHMLSFAEGLFGFGGHRTFVLASLDAARGLEALVAVDDDAVQVPVIDAGSVSPAYPIFAAQLAAGMAGEEVAVALVVCRPADGRPATVNLRAPVVIGLASRRGVQVILDSDLPVAAEIG